MILKFEKKKKKKSLPDLTTYLGNKQELNTVQMTVLIHAYLGRSLPPAWYLLGMYIALVPRYILCTAGRNQSGYISEWSCVS